MGEAMSSVSRLVQVFTVCAGVAACGSLQKIEADVKAPPPSPGSRAYPLKIAGDGFDDPIINLFSVMFGRRSCLMLPFDDFTYVNKNWVLDCTTGIRRTESGDFLVRQLLKKEYEKKIGVFKEPVSKPDAQIFRFVG